MLGKLVTVASRRLAGRPAAVRHGPAQGLRLQVEPRSLAWLTGKVEREVQATLVARLKPGDIVVDAGASIGFHSLLAAQLVGPSGTVIAFEPSPADAEALRANAALNGLANVSVEREALSGSVGSAFLDRPGEATARLVDEPARGALAVATTSLDAFLAAHPGLVPALVKIDVEGHEAAVLEGMRATLAGARPLLIVELHDDRGFLRTLDEAGYSTGVLEPFPSVDAAPASAHVLAAPRDRG